MAQIDYNQNIEQFPVFQKNGDLLIPKRVTIETIFGCNCKCIMCPVNMPTKRKKQVMDMDLFLSVIDSLVPFQKEIEMMDLFCLGEPLLDPHIFDRIAYVKTKGFKNVAISTNADLMNEDKQKKLLESKIDTVIFSIDGIQKETHESIRTGSNFENVVSNCENIIKLRNDIDADTRFIFRFIRQEKNRDEWPEYVSFWKGRINPAKNDFISAYDVHTWEKSEDSEKTELDSLVRDEEIERKCCSQIFNILYILADGTVPLCSEDWLHPYHAFGNVRDKTAVEIFNSPEFNKIRSIHLLKNKRSLVPCKGCSILYSDRSKEIVM